MSRLFSLKNKKKYKKIVSAVVVIGTLRVILVYESNKMSIQHDIFPYQSDSPNASDKAIFFIFFFFFFQKLLKSSLFLMFLHENI